jgi:hypothetical protein
MRKMLITMLMVTLVLTQSGLSYAESYENIYGDYTLEDTRPDGLPGYQWYEESWNELELVKFTVDKKGTCTAITLFDRMKGMTITFDFKITKENLSKYKLLGNKFFYNYQADWLQVETKKGIVIYADMPYDPKTGKTHTINILH